MSRPATNTHTQWFFQTLRRRDNGQPRAIQPQKSLRLATVRQRPSINPNLNLPFARETRLRNHHWAEAVAPRDQGPTRRNTSTHPVPGANQIVSTLNARARSGERSWPRSLRTRRGTARRSIRRERSWAAPSEVGPQTLGTKPTLLYAPARERSQPSRRDLSTRLNRGSRISHLFPATRTSSARAVVDETGA